MNLKKPSLYKRSNKQKPFTNKFLGDIEELFSKNRESTSLHFFSNKNGVKNQLWKKFVSDSPFNIKELKEKLEEGDLISDLTSEIILLNKNGLELKLIVFYDEVDWKNENPNIYEIEFQINQDNQISKVISEYSKIDFEKKLRVIQEEDMIMNKRLNYSTSELEGYLSDMCYKNNNPVGRAIFPGDVDLIIYDKLEVQLFLEFKKHTTYGSGNIENQSFTKYWFLDKKKYTGLASLAERFHLDFFYNIIYSTRENELKKLKIEKIQTKNIELDSFEIFEIKSKQQIPELIDHLIDKKY